MTSLSVLGLGNWGTALANHLALAGHNVLGWTIEEVVAEGINAQHRNPNYLSHVPLSENVKATTSLEAALSNDILVLVVPSAALSQVVPQLKLSKGALLVSAVKGLELERLETPLQFCRRYLAAAEVDLAVISGPSFARDVALQHLALVVAASEKQEIAERVRDIFAADSLRVYTSVDPLGVELGGILKNVVALAVGVCDGMQLGDSARGGLVTRGLAEMTRLAEAAGADRQTLFGLSGLGDLVMTATCDQSRNRTVGLRLGRGETLDHILSDLGSVAEGVKTTPLVLQLARQYQVEMPIAVAVAELLRGETTPQEMAHGLIGRPLKAEFE